PTLRVLEVKKNNYGPVNENILLRWRDGVYTVVPGEGSVEKLAEDARVDELFLKLLRRFSEQGRNVSHNSGRAYAPSKFAEDPEARAANSRSKQLAAARERLFAAGRIKAVAEGRPSHKTYRLVVTAESAEVVLFKPRTGQQPANDQPTP